MAWSKVTKETTHKEQIWKMLGKNHNKRFRSMEFHLRYFNWCRPKRALGFYWIFRELTLKSKLFVLVIITLTFPISQTSDFSQSFTRSIVFTFEMGFRVIQTMLEMRKLPHTNVRGAKSRRETSKFKTSMIWICRQCFQDLQSIWIRCGIRQRENLLWKKKIR